MARSLSDDSNGVPYVASFDASGSLTAFGQERTIIAVIEMSQSKVVGRCGAAPVFRAHALLGIAWEGRAVGDGMKSFRE